MTAPALIAACALCLAVVLFWERRELAALAAEDEAQAAAARRWIHVFKPLASLAFLALALTGGALGTVPGAAIFAGLFFSFLGDVFLMSRAKRWFTLGLFAFLLGHVAYVVAFALHGMALAWAGVALAALLPVAALVLRWLLGRADASLKGPVIAYVVVISAMVATAAGALGLGAPPLVLAGAIAFYLSDLTVARDRFVTRGFENRIVGLPLYYTGQVLLALSVATFAP